MGLSYSDQSKSDFWIKPLCITSQNTYEGGLSQFIDLMEKNQYLQQRVNI